MLPHLFPIQTHVVSDVGNPHLPVVNGGVEGRRESLDTSIVAISHIFQLLGGAPGLSSSIIDESIQRLIQVAALDAERNLDPTILTPCKCFSIRGHCRVYAMC